MGGITLRLADTAGVRETEDVVESIGVDRAVKRLENAELVLAVFDFAKPLDNPMDPCYNLSLSAR